MSEEAAPQNKFGFCEDCPPTSDLGLAVYHMEFPVFILIVGVSLIAGLKLSSKDRLLPLLAMAAIGALIFQLSQSAIDFQKQFNVSYVNSDRSFSSDHERVAFYQAEFSKIEGRYVRIFSKGWAAYSLLPFLLGLTYGITKRRRKARSKAPDQPTQSEQPARSV